MHMETFIRKQLKMKAHLVPKVEETPEEVVVWIDRLGQRSLRCGRCGLVVRQAHSRGPFRRWRHLAMGKRHRTGWRTAPSGSGWNGCRGPSCGGG